MPCQYQKHCSVYETLNCYSLLNNSQDIFTSLSLPISFIQSSCHYSPCQVWKEAAVPGCDVLIPLVLIDGVQGKNPPRTGTLSLGKKPWITPSTWHTDAMKTMEIFQHRTGREQIKRLKSSQCSRLHNFLLSRESRKCSAWLICRHLGFWNFGLTAQTRYRAS